MILKPDRKTFEGLTRKHRIIPVFMTVPADLETPVSIYLKVAASLPYSFLLESGDLGEKARFSFIGCDPFLTLEAGEAGTVINEGGGSSWSAEGDPLQVLNSLLHDMNAYQPPELEAFWGGAVGYLSYGMVREWEDIPPSPGEDNYPRCGFFFPRKILIYDHRRHLLTLVYMVYLKEGINIGKESGNNSNNSNNSEVGDKAERGESSGANTAGKKDYTLAYDDARLKLQLMLHNLRSGAAYGRQNMYNRSAPRGPGNSDHDNAGFAVNKDEFSREPFMAAVEKAKEYIRAGDIFQVVLSRRVSRDLKIHPFSLYRSLRSLNPSPYQFYLSLKDFQLIGASPEMLVSLTGGKAATRPIAGTRPRGRDKASDQSLADELKNDEKERAEHMMLVDLGRNDLGRVCRYGSVEVSKLLETEYYSHVIHLVSEVTGTLCPDKDFTHLIKSSFPAGTVSGAPKVRAMEIIAGMEPVARGPYAGAVGYVGFNGDMDTCITIRTIVTREGKALIQAGAGIVADSDPGREFEETEHKMAGALKALELAEELEKNDPYYR